MKKSAVLSSVVAVVTIAVAVIAQAQQRAKVARIGYLTGQFISSDDPRLEALRQGLRDFGYFEGKNIAIEWRGADGSRERQRAYAAELARLNVDVIVTAGSTSTRAAKDATSTIPIIMTNDGDPVGRGLVASLARPGGNITGLSSLSPELSGKRLEILKEVVPGLSRVAVLGSSTSADEAQVRKEIELAADVLKVRLQYLDVTTAKDIEPAFRAADKGRAQAVLVIISGTVATRHRKEIAQHAVKSRLPAIYYTRSFIEADGLMYYGVNLRDLSRRAATYGDKILKGAKPAELPVEQPTKFEFIVNLKAAKQIGLAIPPNVLVRADRVIK